MRGERMPGPERGHSEKTWEVDLKNEHDRKEAVANLRDIFGEEAAEQLIFVMHQVTSVKDFANHCNHATQELGRALDERFGGEESFFDLAPSTRFSDAQSDLALHTIGYRGSFHSVGVVCSPDTNHPISVIIDLTHFTVNGSRQKERSTLIATVAGDERAALKKLDEIYGGKWAVTLAYNKQKKVFRSKE